VIVLAIGNEDLTGALNPSGHCGHQPYRARAVNHNGYGKVVF
jgi:hypothetical protein